VDSWGVKISIRVVSDAEALVLAILENEKPHVKVLVRHHVSEIVLANFISDHI
jgi:hypothetical protein